MLDFDIDQIEELCNNDENNNKTLIENNTNNNNRDIKNRSNTNTNNDYKYSDNKDISISKQNRSRNGSMQKE